MFGYKGDVSVSRDSKDGRYFVAKRAFEKGEIVFSETFIMASPLYLTIQNKDNGTEDKISKCANWLCWKTVRCSSDVVCSKCKRKEPFNFADVSGAIYCSSNCMEKMKPYHWRICDPMISEDHLALAALILSTGKDFQVGEMKWEDMFKHVPRHKVGFLFHTINNLGPRRRVSNICRRVCTAFTNRLSQDTSDKTHRPGTTRLVYTSKPFANLSNISRFLSRLLSMTTFMDTGCFSFSTFSTTLVIQTLIGTFPRTE